MNIDDDFNDHATHVPREETPSDTSYLTYILLGWGQPNRNRFQHRPRTVLAIIVHRRQWTAPF